MTRLANITVGLVALLCVCRGQDQPFFVPDPAAAAGIACDPGAWNPAINSNTLVVYDFNCLQYAAGTSISNVTDLAFGIRNMASSGTRKPYYTNNVSEINNQGYAYFDGIDDTLQMTYSAGIGVDTTFFLVLWTPPNPTATPQVFVDTGHNLGPVAQGAFTYQNAIYMTDGGGGHQSAPFIEPITWFIMELRFNSGSSYIKTNNVTAVSTTMGNNANYGLTLGSDMNQPTPGGFANCKVAWACVLTNAPSATIQSNIYYYLDHRFPR